MDLREMRIWIAGRLGREDLTDSSFDLARCLGVLSAFGEGRTSRKEAALKVADLLHFEDFLEPPEIAAARIPALLPYTDVASLASVDNERKGEDKEQRETEPPTLKERDLERARALGDYVALAAALHPSSQRFRMFALGDYVTSRGDVWELQDAPEERHIVLGPNRNRGWSGFLDALESAGEQVSEHFRGYWSPEEAIEFILADRVAWRYPAWVGTEGVSSASGDYGTITLEVEPWLPSAAISQLYQREQQRLLGHTPRALSPHGVRLVRFVLTQVRAKMYARLAHEVRSTWEDAEFSWYEGIARNVGTGPGELLARALWRPLMERWNEITHEGPYESERRFRTDFYRTVNAISGTLLVSQHSSGSDVRH